MHHRNDASLTELQVVSMKQLSTAPELENSSKAQSVAIAMSE